MFTDSEVLCRDIVLYRSGHISFALAFYFALTSPQAQVSGKDRAERIFPSHGKRRWGRLGTPSFTTLTFYLFTNLREATLSVRDSPSSYILSKTQTTVFP